MEFKQSNIPKKYRSKYKVNTSVVSSAGGSSAGVTPTTPAVEYVVTGTTAEWAADEVGSGKNTILKSGQIGIEFIDSDSAKIKIGNGVSTWENLDYVAHTKEEVLALLTDTAIMNKSLTGYTSDPIDTTQIVAADSILSAFKKLQGQINTKIGGEVQIDAETLQGKYASDFILNTEVATTGTADKLIRANAQGKLAVSITGDADTLDGKHSSDFILLSSKGVANGIAELDSNGKLPLSQVQDVLLGQVKFGGTFVASGIITSDYAGLNGQNISTISATTYKGYYFIAQAAVTILGIEFGTGDWAISNGTAGWAKIDNTDAVTSVAGRIGSIVLTKSDVGLSNVDNTADSTKSVSYAASAGNASYATSAGSAPASDVFSWAKAATKPAYTYTEVGAAASSHNHAGIYEPVFVKNSAFNKNFGSAVDTVCQGNDARLSDARPASDVYAWAKTATKPSYTKAEVGLGNVDNTADQDKYVYYATSADSAGYANNAGYAATAGSASANDVYAWAKAATKPSYTYSEVGAAAASHSHSYEPVITAGNTAQYWRGDKQWATFPTSLPASDVYSWAKASTKPSYTKAEVGLGNVDNTADANKSVNYAASAGSANSATSASYASYLPTAYAGGQQLNPQTYFGMGVGLKVAMTAAAGVWSDTLWINGYAGSDVRNMCALHFQRNGTPRMYISNQLSDSTSYGSLYEVVTAYNYTSFSPTLTGSGASGTWGINISGNANSATSSASVSGLHIANSGWYYNIDNSVQNYIGYVSGAAGFGQSDGGLYTAAYSSAWQHQIYGDFRSGQIAVRGKNNGSWQGWRIVLDSSNYNSYAPTLSGAGASGTWGINITGTAGYASSAGSAGNSDTVDSKHIWTGTQAAYNALVKNDNTLYFITG